MCSTGCRSSFSSNKRLIRETNQYLLWGLSSTYMHRTTGIFDNANRVGGDNRRAFDGLCKCYD